MTTEFLATEVVDFLTRYVRSFDDLGVLVALIENDRRWWDSKSMAAHAGIDAVNAKRALEAFARQNLLDIRITDDIRYRLRPGNLDLENGLHAFAASYHRAPTVVLRWVASLAPPSIIDFAAAFRIKRR